MGEEEDDWRGTSMTAYYEHPLSAATSAMLNISGPPTEEHPSLLYQYHKLAPGKEKFPEIWPQVSEVRRWSETSDLTCFETRSPENLDCYDDTSRGGLRTRLMAGSAGGGGILSASGAGLKGGGLELGAQQIGDIQGLFGNRREPEDLRKQPDKRQHKLLLVSSPSGAQGQDLVVDVVNNNAGVKAEFSPRNGTPPPSTLMSHEGVELLGDVKYGSAYTEPASYSGYLTPRPPPPPPTTFADSYYREYLAEQAAYARPFDAEGSPTASFVERYVRQSSVYHNKGVIAAAGLTVDLPSPDSGIGADTVAPRDQQPVQQGFDYSEVCGSGSLLNEATRSPHFAIKSEHASPTQTRSRPWHDFGRQTDADKIQIPKLYSNYGFKYFLETPISTNQRRDDDRVTYINKGQFYGITMEYVPDPDRPLKTQTVKSVVMLMFREEKSPEDEIKAWQFWHGRQHSVKQRILDADTKNSIGFIGCIEEVAHNAVAVYWNPLESSAKLNIAIQCLSTDFSSQKGVKGLPLHIQIDTYEDHRDGPVFHRGYCQIKVFCDKGAERKTRDEERRAQKRKMAATGCASGRKKMEELYHQSCERSEFYSMADLSKPPVLFSPAEDIDKLTSMELQGFYGHETDTSSLSNGEAGSIKQNSQYLLHSGSGKPSTTTAQTLKFHHHFPPDTLIEKKEDTLATTDGSVYSSPPIKRQKVLPPLNERVMLYVRQDNEEVYTPLHVAPPDTSGLLKAIENKYKISASSISNLYRKNRKGILAKIDDDMLKYYCNEDLFLLEVRHSEESEDLFDVILVEYPDN